MFLALRSSSTFIISTISIAVFTDFILYSVIVPVILFALTNRAGVPPQDGMKTFQPPTPSSGLHIRIKKHSNNSYQSNTGYLSS